MEKPLNVCALQDGHLYKEKQNVGNNFDCHRRFAVAGGTPLLASQQAVGLLPEWRAWFDPFNSDHPVAAGADLSG